VDYVFPQMSFYEGNQSTQMVFLENFCMVLFVSGPTRQGTRNENYDILVLRCISCVEPCRIVMMVSKTMLQL
jgi:hypothetical protein